MPGNPPAAVDCAAWQQLQAAASALRARSLREWFAADAERFAQCSLQACGLLFDFSRQRVDATVLDGFEALAMCLKSAPDLILADLQMPRMDGWQLLRVVRGRPSLASVPVIFLTSVSDEDERLHGYQLGVDDFVVKPFRAPELGARIFGLLRRARMSAATL